MTGIVLQARIDSSRLPKKALLPLDGEPMIFRVMQALNHLPADIRILACSEDSASSFKPLAKNAGFCLFAGPKDDVLERFCQVIRKFSLTRVVRATGDNPFVFVDTAISINAEAASLEADYAAYSALPYGAGVESICAEALLRAAEQTAAPFDREHVCPCLYNNPDKFRVHRPLAPLNWQRPDMRLTVDTQEDYERAAKLYGALKNENVCFNGNTIIKKYLLITGE